MAAHLEKIPRDVLQHIGYLSAFSSVLGPPVDLYHLLLASTSVYRSLSIYACPHLYASIFRAKFDSGWGQHFGLPDSVLAVELLQRFLALRRVRRRNLCPKYLWWDLRTILRMVIENQGINVAQLSATGFSDFIQLCVRARLGIPSPGVHRNVSDSETDALAIWILCLTLSRYDILNTPDEIRQEVLPLLRPFTLSAVTRPVVTVLPCFLDPTLERPISNREGALRVCAGESIGGKASCTLGWKVSSCPDPSSAAIILTFALNEATPLATPPHLPETRAIAIATQRSGPTMEDFRALEGAETPLFADLKPRAIPANTSNREMGSDNLAIVDPAFFQVMKIPDVVSPTEAYFYTPGRLTGLWEGSYMVASEIRPIVDNTDAGPASFDFTCGKPMQCVFSEYMCFSPHLPLPSNDTLAWDVSPCSLLTSEDGFELNSRKFRYEKLLPPSNGGRCAWRDPCQALDIVIIGETLEAHEQAWGGFKFAGRIYRDGSIMFWREPKHANELGLGTWVFEGRLRYGAAFVGRWRSSPMVDNCGIQGIFSLHKSKKQSQE